MELGLLELASIVAGAGSSSGVLGGSELVAVAVKGEMKFRVVKTKGTLCVDSTDPFAMKILHF